MSFTESATRLQTVTKELKNQMSKMLHLCAYVTLILACYRPSAYHLRHVPYLPLISDFMCTIGLSISDFTACTPPSVTISILN